MSRESFVAALDVLTGTSSTTVKNPRDCELCHGGKAVGRYFLHKDESPNPGWWRVCEYCAEMVENLGSKVTYYKYTKQFKEQQEPPKAKIDNPDCQHDWEKWSLVSEVDKKSDLPFDWMRCNTCGCYGKRFQLNQTVMSDLTMEIDLNCSR
ncbi:hypothetical protein HUO09_17745 [Vibrio sp. Y2-5]|uniref:hypothetical protein n=1 Tax=Vibrio sp. Y2-5 TaxID=2743977 RepID=UPI0016606E81|nr:hypothetical protein [Vibrio sp. Y2-5]MBD0788202.1 hypothetical protein [Vibrio sp. Y2-5]